jgi:hypothetical protein
MNYFEQHYKEMFQPGLTYINLGNELINIRDEDVKKLVEILNTNPNNVNALDLGENFITIEGLQMLRGLQPSINYLDLSCSYSLEKNAFLYFRIAYYILKNSSLFITE